MSPELYHKKFIDYDQSKPDVPEGEIFDAWRLKLLSSEEFWNSSNSPDHLSTQQLAYLGWFGLLGPTTHNTIPERFILHEDLNEIDLLVDRRFVLPHSDKVGRQATISMGCVVANIETAAKCYGLEPHTELLTQNHDTLKPLKSADDERYTPFVKIKLQLGTNKPLGQLLLHAMLDRKVVRAEYDSRVKIEPKLSEIMKASTNGVHKGLRLHLIQDSPTIKAMAKFYEDAEIYVYNDPDFSNELGHWLLPNDESETPWGMRGIEFGRNNEASQKLHGKLVGEEDMLPDEMAGFAKSTRNMIRSSSAIGVISVNQDDPEHRFHAGRAYEELALLLHQNNLCSSIHAAITEMDENDFVQNNVKMLFKARLGILNKDPTIVFRIGKPRKEEDLLRPHSARPLFPETVMS